MKVQITYYDHDSLTKEEVVAQAQRNYGEGVTVEVYPESDDPMDLIHFALQSLITYDQLGLLFNNKYSYKTNVLELKSQLSEKLDKELDRVIRDNEIRVS